MVKGRHDAALWIVCAVAAALLAANLALFSSGAALPFVDNFDDRRSGWDVYRTGMGGYNYRDGEFAFWISRGGPLLWLAWSPLSEPRPETLVVEAAAYALSGGDRASYGVIFGLDMANYYAFEVRADGAYRVFCHQAGDSLCEPGIWTRAGSAASGSAADRLRVAITGDRAALELNGLELGAISLAALKGPYRVGICGGCEGSGPAEVRFTQFAVSIPSQAELATAEAAPPVYPVCSALQQPGPSTLPGPVGFNITSAGREIVVNSTADSGPGTLRWALETARSGDTVTFDPAAFPPGNPATIYPLRELPVLSSGGVTIDASNGGVIIDGSRVPGDWNNGIQVSSDRNVVRGLQVVNFKGSGIAVCRGSYNTIGGDRSIGNGPLGQGNLSSSNGIGVDVCDPGTSHNTIVGNTIGTGVAGAEPRGNKCRGIWVEDGVSDTQIGPDNVVAFNGCGGIVITGSLAVRNTITRNAVYRNDGAGIRLDDGANEGVGAPLITGFDLTAGEVTGLACAGCRVELFSSNGLLRERYEGSVVADATGRLAFRAATALQGPSLVGTSTTPTGSSSVFSFATTGDGRELYLQKANWNAKAGLSGPSGPSDVSLETRMGIMFYILCSDDSWESACWCYRQAASLRASWIRLSFEPFDWRLVRENGYTSAEVSTCERDAIRCLAENGVQVMYTLNYWPPALDRWQGRSRFSLRSEVEGFLGYVRSLVRTLRGDVTYYEILNEPNIEEGTPQHVELSDYIALVREAAAIIRQEDPVAKIVLSGGSNLSEPGAQEWLLGLLASGVVAAVDGVAWHPMYGASPAYEEYKAYYDSYPATVRKIRNLAVQRGFVGELLVEELTWRTPQNPHPLGHEPWIYGEATAGKYYARGIVLHLGMGILTSIAGEAFESIEPIPSVFRRLSTVMAGHEAIDMPVGIDIEYGPTAYCSFRYPNGDRILAVWTDGPAHDEDPGVPATITFPGLIAGSASGIDVLHGFEQELVYEIVGENTIVRNLLVKDYPLLIRLKGLTMGATYRETVGDGFHRVGEPSSGSGSGTRPGPDETPPRGGRDD